MFNYWDENPTSVTSFLFFPLACSSTTSYDGLVGAVRMRPSCWYNGLEGSIRIRVSCRRAFIADPPGMGRRRFVRVMFNNANHHSMLVASYHLKKTQTQQPPKLEGYAVQKCALIAKF